MNRKQAILKTDQAQALIKGVTLKVFKKVTKEKNVDINYRKLKLTANKNWPVMTLRNLPKMQKRSPQCKLSPPCLQAIPSRGVTCNTISEVAPAVSASSKTALVFI